MSDNPAAGNTNAGNANASHRCELLCFVQQKLSILPVEDLIKLCSDFYKKDEIVSARGIIDQFVSKRLPKRQGSDMGKSTLEDIVKACLDVSNTLPTFYAVDLQRLPPVDVSHCDTSAILHELQMLRKELRSMSALKDEFDQLKNEFRNLITWKDELNTWRSSFEQRKTTSQPEGVPVPFSVVAAENASAWGSIEQQKMKAAAVAKEPRARKKLTGGVFGGSNTNMRMKSAATQRTVDIFVSRLDPDTTDEDVKFCVSDILDKANVSPNDLCIERLVSKHAELYASYHISVKADSVLFKACLDCLMTADMWPVGVFVKRYFVKRDGK